MIEPRVTDVDKSLETSVSASTQGNKFQDIKEEESAISSIKSSKQTTGLDLKETLAKQESLYLERIKVSDKLQQADFKLAKRQYSELPFAFTRFIKWLSREYKYTVSPYALVNEILKQRLVLYNIERTFPI